MSIRNIRLNLLPPEYRPAPTVTVFPFFFGLIVGFTGLFIAVMFMVTETEVNRVSGRVETTKTDIEKLAPAVESYDAIMLAVSELRKLKAVFVYLDNSYVDWYLFIANISPLIPEDVWLLELSGESDVRAINKGRVSVKGMTASGKVLSVSFFMDNLEVSPYFNNVSFVNSVLQYIADKPVHQFNINVDVKSPREFLREWKEPVESENGSAKNVDESDTAATPGAT